MSSAYRYVVFAPGKQPTVEETVQLQDWSVASKHRYAIGISADDGGLVIALESIALNSTVRSGHKLESLLQRWQVRGCKIEDQLQFIKNPTALQPIPGSLLHESVESRAEPALKRKQRAAQEALGRAGLKFQRTLEQHAWLQRVARVVPYALMGLGGLLTIIAGVYFSQRLLDAPTERRHETIQRVVDDAMHESLEAQGNR